MITRRSLQEVGGPIMILSTSFEMAQRGIRLLLVFLAFISINLAVLNLLPVGALDGGQLLLVTIESATGRQIPDMVKIGINLSFWIFFLGLILHLSYRDLLRIFSQ